MSDQGVSVVLQCHFPGLQKKEEYFLDFLHRHPQCHQILARVAEFYAEGDAPTVHVGNPLHRTLLPCPGQVL